MKIIYFYQFFTTPKGSYGTRVYEFTKNWVDLGHHVTVVTSVFYKSDIRAKRFIETQNIDGIRVIIINVRTSNKKSVFKRILGFLSYSLMSCYFALTQRYDVVIASSPPISVGIPGLLAKILRSKKLVLEVRDLWPEAPIALGFLKNKYLQNFFYYFEAYCYKKSDLVIALSPGMRQNILSRYPNEKVISVTNAVNFDLFESVTDVLPASLKDKHFAIYTGNIGKVNNSELLFKAAVKLGQLNRDDIVIVLIGDGQLKVELEFKSKDVGNIMFMGPLPKTEILGIVKKSIASLIPLASNPVLDTSSPNKLFESMAASVPVIQTTNGWIKDLVAEVNCGFTVDSSNEDFLVDKLIYLADNKDESLRMGERGMLYARQYFDKDKLSMDIINEIAKI